MKSLLDASFCNFCQNSAVSGLSGSSYLSVKTINLLVLSYSVPGTRSSVCCVIPQGAVSSLVTALKGYSLHAYQ